MIIISVLKIVKRLNYSKNITQVMEITSKIIPTIALTIVCIPTVPTIWQQYKILR